MNVYWASQHYDGLARIRAEQGLGGEPDTPAFLREAHRRALAERPDAGVVHKVRQVARLAMAGGAGRRAQHDEPGIRAGTAVEESFATVEAQAESPE
jgi:hypothetical protein